MATAGAGWLNFRVSPEEEQHLRAAAEAAHETLTDFVLGAAQARAEALLATTTTVPAAYFDRLLAALDEPPIPMPVLVKAAKRHRTFVPR